MTETAKEKVDRFAANLVAELQQDGFIAADEGVRISIERRPDEDKPRTGGEILASI
jgi:hypothetical protein